MRRGIVLATAVVALVLAGQASAKTWTVWTGSPAKPPASAPEGTELNQFLPAAIQIHRGDSIRFLNNAFHTASVLGARNPAGFPPVLPQPGTTYTGLTDAAGQPLLEGLPKFIYNTLVFGPVGDRRVDDRGIHSSGVFGRAVGVPSYTLTFPRLGSYRVVCLLHPGMQTRVVVKPKGAAVPSSRQVGARVQQQLARSWQTATTLANTVVPANTVYQGIGKTTTLLAFLPKTLTVAAGTTVNFVNMSPSEPHNVGFPGTGTWLEDFLAQTDKVPVGPGAENQVSPVIVYGSEAPGSPFTYDGTNHGNGFLATPLTDDAPGDPPNGLPGSTAVTFTRPGTYHYYCLIHGVDMSGDIIVTG